MAKVEAGLTADGFAASFDGVRARAAGAPVPM